MAVKNIRVMSPDHDYLQDPLYQFIKFQRFGTNLVWFIIRNQNFDCRSLRIEVMSPVNIGFDLIKLSVNIQYIFIDIIWDDLSVMPFV